MTIGEFSDRCGVSPKRLRNYAATGLLPPVGTDPDNGYRYYASGQLGDARLIDALRRAGLPLAGIADLLRDRTPERLDAWAVELHEQSERKHLALASARDLLGPGVGPARRPSAERKKSMHLNSVVRSERGPTREDNEDAVLATDRLVAVADGVGGLAAGELASALATALVAATFTGASPEELEAAVRAANWAIRDRGSAESPTQAMATTLCAAGILDDSTVVVVNVGDCRAYLLHDGALRQLTEDHTLAAQMVRAGELRLDEVADHPHRHVLTRVLGVEPDVAVDRMTVPIVPGDRLLLTSDGLTDPLSPDEIEDLMTPLGPIEETLDSLIERALTQGAEDDTSAILCEVYA